MIVIDAIHKKKMIVIDATSLIYSIRQINIPDCLQTVPNLCYGAELAKFVIVSSVLLV